MTRGPLHVAGTGTFAAEVIEFATAAGYGVVALVEPIDPARIGTEAYGLRVLSPDAPPAPGAAITIGIGADRARVGAVLAAAGWSAATVIHPSAVISPSARIGDGVVIGPLVVVGAETTVHDHALLGRGALVGHHADIGEGAVLNPGANVAGLVTLGRSARVGMGAAIADRRTIGENAVIAAGAVVVRDVPADTRVQGVPARPYGQAAS